MAIDGKVMVNLDKGSPSIQPAEVPGYGGTPASPKTSASLKDAINNGAELAAVKGHAGPPGRLPAFNFMPIMYPGVSAAFGGW